MRSHIINKYISRLASMLLVLMMGLSSCSDEINIPDNVEELLTARNLSEMDKVIKGETLTFAFYDWRTQYAEELPNVNFASFPSTFPLISSVRTDKVMFRQGKAYRIYNSVLGSSYPVGAPCREEDKALYRYNYGLFISVATRMSDLCIVSEQECDFSDSHPWFSEKLLAESDRDRVEILSITESQLITTYTFECIRQTCEEHNFTNRMFEWYAGCEPDDVSGFRVIDVDGPREYYNKIIDLMIERYGPVYNGISGEQSVDLNSMRAAIMADLDEGIFRAEHWTDVRL